MDRIISVNKKASFEYEILEEFEAGIVLKGSEVKAIKESKIAIAGSYVKFLKGEIFIIGMKVSSYKFSREKVEEDRTRKLLLHSYEVNKLIGSVERKGFSLIPLSIYIKKGYVKLNIALAKGKKLHDKRESLAKKDQKRDLERELKKKYNI
jgi:SsrA-binding protein